MAVLYVFITCRFVVGYGGFAILLLLVLAEVTSPLQNAWSFTKHLKDEVASAGRLYRVLSPYFYVFYTVVRGVFGPLFVYRMVVFYLNGGGDGVVPVWAWASWMVVIVCAILHNSATHGTNFSIALALMEQRLKTIVKQLL
ncbi:hypothetical protein E3N88_37365 [Mikania micrantha]|uniref:TLC domain-containing protein n=1 Tax=Mikania micrantha TaxID=192012 RepID=A0A5N6LQZ5_9ASTR|nr:hypothetical protein E3N88_37365 [Mikania micrantha]